MFLKSGCVDETLGEDNIMEVQFEDLNKYIPVGLAIYIRNHDVEASSRKVPFNSWVVKVLNDHTRAISRLYHVKEIGGGYRMEMSRRAKKQALDAK